MHQRKLVIGPLPPLANLGLNRLSLPDFLKPPLEE